MMSIHRHHNLADIIKNTHATLRQETRKYGPNIAWQRHLESRDVLQTYSQSMRELATIHWNGANCQEEQRSRCRIEWIRFECREYYFSGGKEKYDKRECDIWRKMNSISDEDVSEDKPNENTIETAAESVTKRITLLDVGSCYNPFGDQTDFDVTAIDLMGADNTVYQCDFLNVKIGEEIIFSEDQHQIPQLPKCTYDVVVFSLFLEYLPCPRQRYDCCLKAYELLKPAGLLVIVSPDSNHINANAKLIKSWKYVLSKMGFMRIKYEKLPHLHCLVFRKCRIKQVAMRWADLQSVSKANFLYQKETSIYIPQDLQSERMLPREEQESVKHTVEDLMCTFAELPFATT